MEGGPRGRELLGLERIPHARTWSPGMRRAREIACLFTFFSLHFPLDYFRCRRRASLDGDSFDFSFGPRQHFSSGSQKPNPFRLRDCSFVNDGFRVWLGT